MKLWKERHTWVARNAEQKLACLQHTDVKRIAVIKHAAYGDLLCTRPFLVTLRQLFPQASITFCGISHYTRGLPHDLVDRVHIVPSRKDKKGHWHTFKEYKKLGSHDLLFDLTGSTPSFMVSLLNRAAFKIGFQHRAIHKWIYDVAIPRAEFRFEAETFIEQLNLLGFQAKLPLDYGLQIDPIQREKPYLVYFPTASTPDKCWPMERFVQLIDNLATQYPEREHILLKGLSGWERDTVDQASKQLTHHHNVVALEAGPEDARLLKGAALLVANDTGIRHLGLAVGIPTVGIFYHTTPFGYWPRYAHHEVVFDPAGTPPPVDQVTAAVQRILHTK